MKKFLSVLLLAGTVVAVSAQTSATKTDDVSKWSVNVKAGLDYYRVSPPGNGFSVFGWTFPGVSLDYTVNPLFGFGGDISFLTYNRSAGNGRTLDFTIYESTNFSNLFSPTRTGFWQKVNVYGNLGGGFGFFGYDLANGPGFNGISPLIYIGLNAEYTLSRKWALNVEGQYRYYMNKSIGGTAVTGLGSDALIGTVGLRYKFGGDKKHVREMSMDEFYPSPVAQVAAMIKDDNAELMRRMDAIEAENNAIRQRLDKLEGEVSKVKATAEQNSLVAAKYAAGSSLDVDFPEVLFKFQSTKLTEESVAALDQVSVLLNQNVFSKVVVAGHTDSTGSEEFNEELGLKRANTVKDVLTSKGVASSKIETLTYGETKPVAPNTSREGRQKNRRVEFELKK